MHFLSTFGSSCVVTSPKQPLQLSQVEVRCAIPPLCPDSSPGGGMLWSCLSSRLWCQLSERQAGIYPSPCCWCRGSRITTCFSSKSTHNPLCLLDSDFAKCLGSWNLFLTIFSVNSASDIYLTCWYLLAIMLVLLLKARLKKFPFNIWLLPLFPCCHSLPLSSYSVKPSYM